MAVTALSVLKQVALDVLVDPSSRKWQIDQLVRYLNRIQRVVSIVRPDAFLLTQSIELAAGYRQSLPAGYVRLLGATHNTASGKRITMPVNCRAILDAQVPNWRAGTQRDDVQHVIYDVRDPLFFDVYPPATASAAITGQLQKGVTDISEPGANLTYANVSGNLSITDDLVAPAIVEGICWLAYAKDAQHAAQAQRATTHVQNMAAALGVELQALHAASAAS